MICKSCGTDNEDEVSFCTSCGEALAQEEDPIPRKSLRDRLFTKRNLVILSGGAVLVLILILVLALLLHNPAERAVNELYEAVLHYDYDKVVGFLPPAVVDSLKERLALDDSELEIMDSKELTPVYIAEIDQAYQQKFATPKGYIEDAAIVHRDQMEGRDPDPGPHFCVHGADRWRMVLRSPDYLRGIPF